MASLMKFALSIFASHVLLANSMQLRQGTLEPFLEVTEDSEPYSDPDILSYGTGIEQSENGTAEPYIFGALESGCGRGFNCGIASREIPSEPMSVDCKDGKRWFARNALLLRGHHGKNAIYCSVPKIGTSYMFGLLKDLHLSVRGGNRNAGYEAVHEIISQNTSDGNKELCDAYSFMMIRNPWERIASAYVDKVLTREVFSKPPKFNKFLKMLADVEDERLINQHFRPASITCQTTGDHAMKFDERIKIENNPRKHLEAIFVHKLGLPPKQVTSVMDKWDEMTHSTSTKGWAEIDPSMASDLSRVDYYMRQSDPSLVAKVYKDDIDFGSYKYHGHR